MNKIAMDLDTIYPIIEEVLASGGEFRLYPRGTSMLPMIRQGEDSVVLSALGDVSVNDVILYKRDDGKFVLHRVVSVKGDEYVMCGDNQVELEYGITRAHALASLSCFYRGDEKITLDNKDYQKYVKSLPRMRKMRKIRAFLGKIKNKILRK